MHRVFAMLAATIGADFFPGACGQAIVPKSQSQLDRPAAQGVIEAEQQKASLDPASPWYLNPSSFLQWGPVTARPHLTTRYTYGNRLRNQAGGGGNTGIIEISPGSLFELGTKWRLDYTPTLSFYSSKEYKDSLDHSVSLNGGTTYGEWAFTLGQSYQKSSQPLIETGRQTDQQNFNTSLGASHYFNSKLMLSLGVNQSFREADEFNSTRSWSTMNWLNYQVAPRLSFGAGLGGGYETVSSGFDMMFEQLQARMDARIAEKLTLAINAGGEMRQILDSGADPVINPIYGASIHYHPFEFTTLSLSGNRTVSASLIAGQFTEATSISVALNQRLLGLLYLTVSGGLNNNVYIASADGTSVNREDDTMTASARLSYGFIERGTIAVFYNYSDNSSSSGTFDYSSTQMGVELSYRF